MRLSVNTSVLAWALARSGRARELHTSFPRLSDWLSGEASPTLRQLEDFARASRMPFGYLLLEAPPADPLPIALFRTKEEKDTPPGVASPELIDTVHWMLRRQAWFREQLIEEGWEPLRFVRSASLTAPPEEVAHQMKEILGLGPTWVDDHRNWTGALKALIDKIDQAGILVAVSGIVGNNTHRILKVDEFRGFVLADEYAPLVFVNGADAKAAQMFTLAHELAHVWFGQSAAFDLRNLEPAQNRIEQACNRVAAEFLVPASLLRRFWPSVRKMSSRFQAIAQQFRVSEIVAARRALELSLITKEEFLKFYLAQTERERRSQQGSGDFYATQNLRIGRRFGEAVIRAAREGRLLYREAYRLVGLHGQTFDRYAQAILGMVA
ncbi:MAG: hypothetical protein DKINENOH_00072 [bacterium]|nr:hypothetical protein [bacterium]MCK6559784.1 ImmA/IrrE family metallo-endopeptidase [bacterium]NUM63735.1 ImmA/IrrE family metallo-endopeptidase [candidate division KSB1 bacterium]